MIAEDKFASQMEHCFLQFRWKAGGDQNACSLCTFLENPTSSSHTSLWLLLSYIHFDKEKNSPELLIPKSLKSSFSTATCGHIYKGWNSLHILCSDYNFLAKSLNLPLEDSILIKKEKSLGIYTHIHKYAYVKYLYYI